MRPVWLSLAAALLVAAQPSFSGEATQDTPSRRAEVTVYPTSKRPRQRLLVPGEWTMISSSRALWMPHVFEGETTLVFRKRAAEVFLARANGQEQLVGVRLGSMSGRPELRSALKSGASPMTIWCYPNGIAEIGSLPSGPYYAVAVDGVSDVAPLAGLGNLSALRLGCTTTLSDLTPLAALTRLESLWLSCLGATDLRPLASLARLKTLHLQCSRTTTDLSPLASLRNLRLLEIDGAEALTDLSPLARLPNLNILVLRNCGRVSDLTPVARLAELNWLGLHDAPLVSDLTPLRKLPRLATIELADCPGVRGLAPLAAIASLEAVGLTRCPNVTDVSPLAMLPKLSRVDILECPGVRDVWALRQAAQQPHRFSVDAHLHDQVVSLEHASPSKITILMEGRYVGSVGTTPECFGEDNGWANILSRSVILNPSLRLDTIQVPYPVAAHRPGSVLDFTLDGARVFLSVDRGPRQLVGVIACSPTGHDAVRKAVANGAQSLVIWADADSLDGLPDLPPGRDYTLVILGLRSPIAPLRKIENLTTLHVAYAGRERSTLYPLAHLKDLETLVLRSTPRVDSLKYLSKLTDLTSLDITLGPRVRDLRPLAKLAGLKALRLTCPRQVDLSPLAELPALGELTLEVGDEFNDLTGLGKLTRLEMLSLSSEGRTTSLQPLAGLASLEVLRLADCRSLTDLSPVASLRNLETLILRSCSRLESLSHVAQLPNLRWLDVAHCNRLFDTDTLASLRRRGVTLNLDTRLRRLFPGVSMSLTQAASPLAARQP